MPRSRRYAPLQVLLNNTLIGTLSQAPSGAISFQYSENWLDGRPRIPLSLSLPLREDAYHGAPVFAVFDNLLPDSESLRSRVAQRVGANGADAYSLLSAIGHDCVGALQFLPVDYEVSHPTRIEGEIVGDKEIERILQNLTQAPLGLNHEDAFRISVAGAQEKTALLFHQGQWIKPHGLTPTTHLFKKSMGRLPNGIDLTHSVENEYYCLKLLAAFGLPVNPAEIRTFNRTKALVVQRFDRLWTADGRLLRLPQEDFCQALSIPSVKKYQSSGGPGMVEILHQLKASNTPEVDQQTFIKTQILFWLMGATDGHAKNFSIFLQPGGRFRLTPIYDVLSVQPAFDSGKIRRKDMKLAMFAGDNRNYVLDYIHGRHFVQTVQRAGLPTDIAEEALAEIIRDHASALDRAATCLPLDFPAALEASVRKGFLSRLNHIA